MPSNNRGEDRSNVFLSASLDTGANSMPVRVRNLSGGGAMLDAPNLPPKGTRVRLKRGTLSAVGTITWCNKTRGGMKFDSKLDLKPWVKPVGHAGQQQVDQVVASFRAGEKALSIKGAATETPSLQLVSSTLDQICERLARVPAVTGEC